MVSRVPIHHSAAAVAGCWKTSTPRCIDENDISFGPVHASCRKEPEEGMLTVDCAF